jgi:hypothetical protein
MTRGNRRGSDALREGGSRGWCSTSGLRVIQNNRWGGPNRTPSRAGSRPVAAVSRRWQFGVTLVNQRQHNDAINGDMNLKRTFAVLTLGISQLCCPRALALNVLQARI